MKETKSTIEPITVKVICSKEIGTGFFISDMNILTAYHVIEEQSDEYKIKIEYNNQLFDATLVSFDFNLDVALIQVTDINSDIQQNTLEAVAYTPRLDETWETFGYPNGVGSRFKGAFLQREITKRWDYILSCDEVDEHFDFGGLSGSPIVASDKICAITLNQIENQLGVISLKKIESFLNNNGISLIQPFDKLDIPESLKDDVSTSSPNYDVFDEIDNAISKSNGWILLHGNPGCGKTTISATYTPDDENTFILGRYFLKVPQDKLSINQRASKKYLIDWFEELYYRTINESLPPVQDFDKKLDQISGWFDNLSRYLNLNQTIGIIVIDGLDELTHLNESALYDFMSIFPAKMPDNVKIILSCTSKAILPKHIKNELVPISEIQVTSLDLSQCENYIQENLRELELPYTVIQELAIKSEGHPLYLNYLISYIENEYTKESDSDEIQKWIKTIPNIEGNIINYYDNIWDKISTDDKLSIIITLSQTRGPVKEDNLVEMLPIEKRISFLSSIGVLRYLLDNYNGLYEIYHNSFKEYIVSKTTPIILSNINDNIIAFCEKKSESEYAIRNYIYNLSKGTDSINCIKCCTQEWADKCAKNDVDPEHVLTDIDIVVSLAIETQQTTEVIRLLLLIQRVAFRYDSVFAENAFELAETMLALKKPEAAYKYLVRENTILISELDSVYFLMLFYELGFIDYADSFLQLMTSRYKNSVSELMDSKKGISAKVFISQLNAFTLEANNGKKDWREHFGGLMSVLKKFADISKENNSMNDYEFFNSIRESGAAWSNSYFLKRVDRYVSIEELCDFNGFPVDKVGFKILAQALLNYEEVNTAFNFVGITNSYLKAVNDLKTCLKKYSFEYDQEELYLFTLSLIPYCDDSDLIRTLISKYDLNELDSNLRDGNGVDVDYSKLFHYINISIFRGYLDEKNEYPLFDSIYVRNTKWEEYIITIVQNIGFIKGKLYNAKSVGSAYDTIYKRILLVLDRIDFTFDERSHWERSYYVPESIFPIIYSNITSIYTEFFPDKFIDLFNHIENRAQQQQLSLYTEGYRKSLFEVVSALIKHETFKGYTIKLLDKLEEHIIIGVQNRWERTPELIRIVKFHALLNNSHKAQEVYQKMLDTSMGPSWYKEDQLALINKVMSFNGNSDMFISNYAALLNAASGEMTFQRYVRYEKESFIKSLLKQGKLSKAIEYFKFELLPSPTIIIQNAESFPIDMPRNGDGYILGANSIVEANGILSLLGTKDISPIFQYALSRIFIVNNDNFRYINYYAELHVGIINDLQKSDPNIISLVLKSITSDILNRNLNENERNEYLKIIQNGVSIEISEELSTSLKLNGYSWDYSKSSEIHEKKSKKETDIWSDASKFIEENAKNTTRQIIIQKALSAFEEGNVSVWTSNYSDTHSELRDVLKDYFESDNEIISSLSKFISQSGYVKWVVVDNLLWFLNGKLSSIQVDKIYALIEEHFKLLIRPDSDSGDKYNWLVDNDENNVTNEQLIVELMIWLLNHPSSDIREKTESSLLWLGKINHDIVVICLLNETIANRPTISTTTCSYILKQLSEENPEIIINTLSRNNELIEKIKNISHFTIYKNYIDLSINLNRKGYTELYIKLKDRIPQTIVLTGSVIVDEPFLTPIEVEIDLLDELGILDKNFCIALKKNVIEFCYPLSPENFVRADRYVDRSFYDNGVINRSYPELLLHALNCAIMTRVSIDNISDIFNIINK